MSNGSEHGPDPGVATDEAARSAATTVVRRRIGRFRCQLACALPDSELQGLIAALAALAAAKVSPQNGHALAGRTTTWLHHLPSLGPVVIKEYRRGGMLRYLRRRHYLRGRTTRPEREFSILRLALTAGVSVPEPVACFTRGELFYRGWLATRLIEGSSFVDAVSSDPGAIPRLVEDFTSQVKLLIRNRIAHVDLHPGNVRVDAKGRLYLFDFDRATVFTGTPEELRDHYHVRWNRAVEKHGLPALLAERFTEGLFGQSACPLTCDDDNCRCSKPAGG